MLNVPFVVIEALLKEDSIWIPPCPAVLPAADMAPAVVILPDPTRIITPFPEIVVPSVEIAPLRAIAPATD